MITGGRLDSSDRGGRPKAEAIVYVIEICTTIKPRLQAWLLRKSVQLIGFVTIRGAAYACVFRSIL